MRRISAQNSIEYVVRKTETRLWLRFCSQVLSSLAFDNMLTPLPCSEDNALHIYPSAKEYTITCEHAVCVYVRANLLEVLAVDHVADNFTAVFTLQFRWVDPCLCDFKSEVAYMSLDGVCIRRRATLVHRPGLYGHTDYGLKVDPHQDFAIGDLVQ